jgi:hypothetical protein
MRDRTSREGERTAGTPANRAACSERHLTPSMERDMIATGVTITEEDVADVAAVAAVAAEADTAASSTVSSVALGVNPGHCSRVQM